MASLASLAAVEDLAKRGLHARSNGCHDVGATRRTLGTSDAARKTAGSAPLQIPAERSAAAPSPRRETGLRRRVWGPQHLATGASIRPDAMPLNRHHRTQERRCIA